MSERICSDADGFTNGVIFSTLKHTDPHTVRSRSTQKDGMCTGNDHIFRNGSFGKLKIAKESNDLADLAKVLPESYQKSNEFSVHKKCGQNVATDDRTQGALYSNSRKRLQRRHVEMRKWLSSE